MQKMTFRHTFLRQCLSAIAIIISIVLLQTTRASAAPADEQAYIRVIHASPDVGIVDVFMDGKKILSNFEFGAVTEYVPLTAGTHMVQLALIGKGIDAAVVGQSIQVQAGTPYTIASLGTNRDGFSFSIFADDNTVVGDKAKIRVYHLSPGTGTSEVAAQNQTLVKQISYKQASEYAPLDAGTYTFRLNADGGKHVVTTTVDLKPWTVTSIFAIGVAEGKPALRLTIDQQPGLPGMPQTGSNPQEQGAWSPAQLGIGWPVTLAILGLIIASMGYGRYAVVQAQEKKKSDVEI